MADRTADVLLVGGGIASATAAAELRQRGYEGSILLATREQDPPYHRPPLTKGYLRGHERREETFVHSSAWYAENDVELCTRTSVTALDTDARVAKLQGHGEVHYGQALVATGAMVRRLNADGAQLDGIHYLRALGNADAVRQVAEAARHVVIVGGSYIGTEIAASLNASGVRCTIVMLEQTTLEPHFGSDAGGFVGELLREHGVDVVAGEQVESFEGDDHVQAILTASGRRIEADAVIVGIGAVPDVMLAKRSGLELGHTGGVRCDSRLRTSAPRVFAAGDMCEYDSPLHGSRVRIEHEDAAARQGRTAARNMLGDEIAHEIVPYFWSDLADWVTLEYVGLGGPWDGEEIIGSIDDGTFAVRYSRADQLVGVLSVNRPDELEAARATIATAAHLHAPQPTE